MIAINLIFFGLYVCFTKYIEMSIINKIFKSRKTVTKVSECDHSLSGDAETESQTVLSRNSSSISPDANESEDAQLEVENNERKSKMKQLNRNIRQLRHHDDKLRQRRLEVMWLDAEISEIMSSIAMTKRQIGALEDDILDKKCELAFLKSEVSADDVELKTAEPILHKKYTQLKNLSEATKLLLEIRKRQKVFQILEHLTYTKCLELKHNLQGSAKKKRTHTLFRNKQNQYGHVNSALHDRKKLFNWTDIKPEVTTDTSHARTLSVIETPSHPVTTVEVVSAQPAAVSDGGITTLFPAVSPIMRSQTITSPLAMVPLTHPTSVTNV